MSLSIDDQQTLFKLAAKRFQWDSHQVSGYVHGVKDGLDGKEPCYAYIQGFTDRDTYSMGYIYGFIDAHGSDVFFTEWCKELELSRETRHYRWWKDALAEANTTTNSDLPG